MTDKKPTAQECIEFIEKFTRVHVDEKYKETFYITNESYDMLDKIKGILELHSSDGEWQQPNSPYKGQWIPNTAKNRFVERIVITCANFIDPLEIGYKTAKAEISKLLQEPK